jgi:hypothetical protein
MNASIVAIMQICQESGITLVARGNGMWSSDQLRLALFISNDQDTVISRLTLNCSGLVLSRVVGEDAWVLVDVAFWNSKNPNEAFLELYPELLAAALALKEGEVRNYGLSHRDLLEFLQYFIEWYTQYPSAPAGDK